MAPVARVDPVSDARPAAHTVRKGDTLYAVAWLYGLDYQSLAAWNRLEHPFVIYPGQVLALDGPPVTGEGATAQTSVSTSALPPPAKIVVRKIADTGEAPRTPAPSSRDPDKDTDQDSRTGTGDGASVEGGGSAEPDAFDGDAPVKRWHWPTKGKVIGEFGKSGRKGMELSGTHEQPVFAASDGKVVYGGAGLVGYGRLVVLKHNKHFLSAYAHNSTILVKEGEVVKGGQRIALMGSSGADRVKLHFEIRRDGKPVNPRRYLPR